MSYGGDPRFLLPAKTTTEPLTVMQPTSQPVLVKPQDPSGYGYSHGPSGPKPALAEPKIVQPASMPENVDNGSIALGNGLISLSNEQIIDKNAQIGARNDLISFFNEQVGLRNQDIRQQNQLIEQQNINAKVNYAIDNLGSNDNKPFSAKEFFSTELTGLSTGLSKGVGETTNVKLGFGASVPLPVAFSQESVKSFGSSLFQGGKQLVAIAPVIGGEYLKLLTTGKSDYSIPKEGVTSVSSGFVESVINPSAGFSKESQAVYASNLAKIDTFIGSIRSTAKTQGLEIPHGQTSYSTAGGAVGTIGAIALSAYGLKDVIPIRGIKIGLGVENSISGAKTEIPYKGIGLGYGGPNTKPLLGVASGKIVRGTPSPEAVVPENSYITSFGRGSQVGAKASGFETAYLTGKPFLSNLEARGKLESGTTKYIMAQKENYEIARTAQDETPKSVANLKTEKFSTVSTQEVLAAAGRRENILYYLTPKGRTGSQGGSTALYISMKEPYQTAMGLPKDIDIKQSSIFETGSNIAGTISDKTRKYPRLSSMFGKLSSGLSPAPKLLKVFAEKANSEQSGTNYFVSGRALQAEGELSGKALEIPSNKKNEIQNIEGSATKIDESNLFGLKVSSKTFRSKTASGQRRTFVSGQKQLADQIRVSSSLQTSSTLLEQSKSESALKPGIIEKIGKKALSLPPAFRAKDLVREDIKTESYAQEFEEKGQLEKASTLRANMKIIKDYANKFYDIDWANIGNDIEQQSNKSIFTDLSSGISSAKKSIVKSPSIVSPSGLSSSGLSSKIRSSISSNLKSASSRFSSSSSKLVSPKPSGFPSSTKSTNPFKSPRSGGSSSRLGSFNRVGSPSVRGSPRSSSSSGVPSGLISPSVGASPSPSGSPRSGGSPRSPSSPSPNNPVFPPGTPNRRQPPLFKFGALTPKSRTKGRLGPTRTYLHEVNNIFASSLSIKRIK